MPQYKYRFVKPSTGRQNSASRYAYDEASLRSALAAEGIAEVVSIEEVPADLATGPQLDYLRDLGVPAPAKVTKAEASDLIDNATKKRMPADDAARSLAARYKVEATRYASKQSLYRAIAYELRHRDDPATLAEWFVFRVYRAHFDRSRSGIADPSYQQFRPIVEALANDAQALASLRRAFAETDAGFRWFGSYTAPDGLVYQGDSRRTACFKLVHERLVAAGLVQANAKSEAKASTPHADIVERALDGKKGCLGSIVLLCAVPLSFLVFALY